MTNDFYVSLSESVCVQDCDFKLDIKFKVQGGLIFDIVILQMLLFSYSNMHL